MNLLNNNSTISIFIKDFFEKGHERSISVKKNILASFIIRILSILISLIIVPLTINYVNPVQYGIWITLTSIIGWLGYFDIGLGNGLRNRFAEAVALGDHKMAKVYVSTTYAVLGGILFILALLFTLFNRFLNWPKILNAPDSMRAELGHLALIIIVLFCSQLLLQLLVTVLTANQQPAKASAFNLAGSFVSLAAIFILTKTTTGNLIYLGIAISLAPVVILFLSSIWFYTHQYQAYSPSISYVDFRYIRRLLGLGIKFFILQIATLILYQTSNLIIAHLSGSESVTLYNIAFKYFNIVPMFMLIIMMPLWSAFTDAWTRKEVPWITNTMKKLNYIWIALSILVVVMMIFSSPVYKLWVGSDLHVPFSISIALAVSIIVNIGAYIYSIFLNGVGIIKIQLLLSVFGTIIFIPLAIFLGKMFGPPGVVSATALVNLLNVIFFIIQYNKIVNSKATGLWAK
ncbi:MAG: oligosaccharide flippase family protein [Bacteroidales bacterium]|nr:oligosaccharide flippase family protein [Bacteroidales bacterium]